MKPVIGREIRATLPHPVEQPQFGMYVDIQFPHTIVNNQTRNPEVRNMENFTLQRAFARSKVIQTIIEADIPQDPSMYARRNKGLMWNSELSTLPDREDGDENGQPSEEVNPLELDE